MQKAQNNCNYPSSETRQKYGILTEDKAISHKKLEKGLGLHPQHATISHVFDPNIVVSLIVILIDAEGAELSRGFTITKKSFLTKGGLYRTVTVIQCKC